MSELNYHKARIRYMMVLILIACWTSLLNADIKQRLFPPENLVVSFNGKLSCNFDNPSAKIHSPNGSYWCQYEITKAGDENRQLTDFRFYRDNNLQFVMAETPGSDLYISNSGIIAFMDHTFHFNQKLTVHFYSEYGNHLLSKTFKGASLFGFSPSGNKFGIGDDTKIYVISIADKVIDTYDRGFQFAIAEDDNLIAIAYQDQIKVFAKNKQQGEFFTDFDYTGSLIISSALQAVIAIDKKHLKTFSLANGNLLFADTLSAELSFRDLDIVNNAIIAGIQYRDNLISTGILRAYDLQGNILLNEEKSSREIKVAAQDNNQNDPLITYEEIPWPFAPFDSVCMVWNYYEQHMGIVAPDWSYLHQGLDIITPIAEPTYAVKAGIVKCVLSIGGPAYWRMAISPEQSAGWSTGWLYAHLIQNTIQFDVGDTVQLHDYLGDIVEWTDDWGHIHFVEIRDTGLVWSYSDNEWGITYNPLLSLTPDTDTVPPVIENVFPDSRFAFCTNETSAYLDPDSLYGEIDIITKIVDYVGDSPWQQPAFCLYYWIVSLPEGDTVLPRIMGQILNHAYDFYSTDPFEPYATLLYKRDSVLQPSSWMDTLRNYYHILTNNNGDSLADLSEKQLAFNTGDYYDGVYRLYVEAFDEYGNSVVDSQDIQFKNGNVNIDNDFDNLPSGFHLSQNYPNPFNSATRIDYNIPEDGIVTLKIYDMLGKEIKALVDEFQRAGGYSVIFQSSSNATGIYFCRLQWGMKSKIGKMILLK